MDITSAGGSPDWVVVRPELQATIVTYLGRTAIICTLLGLALLALKGGLRRLFR